MFLERNNCAAKIVHTCIVYGLDNWPRNPFKNFIGKILNVIGDSNDEINFLHKFSVLLTDGQVSMLHKTFSNNSSANIKLSKT